MSGANRFFDTSVLLYLLSSDAAKADRVEALLSTPGVVSVQVLNEFAVVALRKLKMPLNEIREILDTIRAVCAVEPVTVETHDRGLAVLERYRFSLYDSMLVAAALIAGAKIIYSEDLQHGQVIDHQLRVTNPFRARVPIVDS
jgi:predicted nucleic acid-binding protein